MTSAWRGDEVLGGRREERAGIGTGACGQLLLTSGVPGRSERSAFAGLCLPQHMSPMAPAQSLHLKLDVSDGYALGVERTHTCGALMEPPSRTCVRLVP